MFLCCKWRSLFRRFCVIDFYRRILAAVIMGDQQFRLRWNNHQNTLISVFDSLLEGEILVDCTLAAEGKFLRAHKVVLSACSPFFSDLLRQHYEQHPILIMKDVKFDQLKAMLDYMYRGEVNISQDKLGTFLKAAESLQIKGLSDSAPSNSLHSKQKVSNVRLSSKLDDDTSTSRSNNVSPVPRKKKRRCLSGSGEETLNEDSSSEQLLEISSLPPSKLPSNSRLSNPPSPLLVPQEDSAPLSDEPVRQLPSRSQPASTTVFSKSDSFHQHPHIGDSVLYEPKSEFVELNDDDEGMDRDEDSAEAGPSHSKSDGTGFNWQVDQSDESFLPQETLAGHRNAQGSRKARFKLAIALQHLSGILHTNVRENSSAVYEGLAKSIGQAVGFLKNDGRTVENGVSGAMNKKSRATQKRCSPKKQNPPKLVKKSFLSQFDVDVENKLWLVPKVEIVDIGLSGVGPAVVVQ